MVDEPFVPKKGDVVKFSFDSQPGHEQKRWRPGLIISNFIPLIELQVLQWCVQ